MSELSDSNLRRSSRTTTRPQEYNFGISKRKVKPKLSVSNSISFSSTMADPEVEFFNAEAPPQPPTQASPQAPPSGHVPVNQRHVKLSFKPPIFNGSQSENALSYLNQLNWYFKANHVTNDQDKICTVALSLKNSALTWFQSLRIDPDNTDDTFTYSQFTVEFKKQYSLPQTCHYRNTAELFTIKQETLSVDDYLSKIQSVAQKASCSDEIIIQATISGLNPEIRTAIMHHDIESFSDIQYWAKIFEQSSIPNKPTQEPTVQLASKIDEMSKFLQHSVYVNNDKCSTVSNNCCTSTCCNNMSHVNNCSACVMSKNSVHNVDNRPTQNRMIMKCRFCARSHLVGKCFAYGKHCNSCKAKNHFSVCCPKRHQTEPKT